MSDFPPSEPFGGSLPNAAGGEPASMPVTSAPGPKKQSWKTWLAAGTIAVLIAGGGGYVISKQSDDASAVGVSATDAPSDVAGGAAGRGQRSPGGQGTSGTVTAIDGTTLTIEIAATDAIDASTLTVTTTADTTVTATVDGTASDLAVGDNILALGTTADDGTVTATGIIDNRDQELTDTRGGPPPAGAGNAPAGEAPSGDDAAGTPPAGARADGPRAQGRAPGGGAEGTSGAISAIEGDRVTVETADGSTVTVVLAADTTVTLTEVVSLDDLAEGDTVVVTGTVTESTVAATAIRKGDLPAGGFAGGPGRPPRSGAAPDGGDDAPSTTTP